MVKRKGKGMRISVIRLLCVGISHTVVDAAGSKIESRYKHKKTQKGDGVQQFLRLAKTNVKIRHTLVQGVDSGLIVVIFIKVGKTVAFLLLVFGTAAAEDGQLFHELDTNNSDVGKCQSNKKGKAKKVQCLLIVVRVVVSGSVLHFHSDGVVIE